MAKQKKHATIDDAIVDAEYVLAKYNFIKSYYPDVTLNGYYNGYVSKNPDFLSKTVNTTYSKFRFSIEFPRDYNKTKSLIAYQYVELEFQHNSQKEIILVYSKPRSRTVGYIERPKLFADPSTAGKKTVRKKDIIRFSEFIKNLHNNKFDEKMLKECQATIIKFIKEHPDCELDQTNLDDRLKKLLWFT